MQELLLKGQDALNAALEVAKQSEHPRAFEVFATLLKNVGELNDKLLETQKKMREMDGKKKEVNNTNIDKAIFVGSTSELSKLLKGKS